MQHTKSLDYEQSPFPPRDVRARRVRKQARKSPAAWKHDVRARSEPLGAPWPPVLPARTSSSFTPALTLNSGSILTRRTEPLQQKERYYPPPSTGAKKMTTTLLREKTVANKNFKVCSERSKEEL